jgi:hypothetical protein
MDRLVVPTPLLAQTFNGFIADIRVVETRLDPQRWGSVSTSRRAGTKPRIGLAARGAQPEDIELLSEVIKALAEEVAWVLIGYCPPALRPFMEEIHSAAEDGYPGRLASLDLDLALTPLQDTLLNRCKSHERLLEFGICGVPVIGSDIEPHRGLPVTLVNGDSARWMEAIRAHLTDLDATHRQGDQLQACVRRDWMLDPAALQRWREGWLPSEQGA